MVKKKFFMEILVIVLVFEMTVVGCSSQIESMKDPTFSSDFTGTWKRSQSEYTYTLTFTSNTLKASNQNYYWNLQRVSGDRHRVTVSTGNGYNATLIIRLVNGYLEIDDDDFQGASHYDAEHDWTGIWERQ